MVFATDFTYIFGFKLVYNYNSNNSIIMCIDFYLDPSINIEQSFSNSSKSLYEIISFPLPFISL